MLSRGALGGRESIVGQGFLSRIRNREPAKNSCSVFIGSKLDYFHLRLESDRVEQGGEARLLVVLS